VLVFRCHLIPRTFLTLPTYGTHLFHNDFISLVCLCYSLASTGFRHLWTGQTRNLRYKKYLLDFHKYVGPPYWPRHMLLLISHVEYASRALLSLEKDWTGHSIMVSEKDGTNRRTPDRYITLTTRRGQCNKTVSEILTVYGGCPV